MPRAPGCRPVPLAPVALPVIPPVPAAIAAETPVVIEDKVSGLLPSIAEPAVLAALNLHSDPAALDSVIHAAVQALANHDAPRALQMLTQLIQKQPESVPRVLEEPGLVPLHASLHEAIDHVTQGARAVAETTVAQATRLTFEDAPVIALANQFIETGQYINYIRATELGRLAISDAARKTPPAGETPAARMAALTGRAVTTLWRRAPLLVLFLGWLLAGFFLPAQLWAPGFLGLVVLQFVLTLRNRSR